MQGYATTPQPPYWAVIFMSRRPVVSDLERTPRSDDGYAAMADEMEKAALTQPGYLGIHSARDADGLGITVSYWRDEAAIAAWKADARHRVAQRLGHERWYEHYEVRVAKVERAYASVKA